MNFKHIISVAFFLTLSFETKDLSVHAKDDAETCTIQTFSTGLTRRSRQKKMYEIIRNSSMSGVSWEDAWHECSGRSMSLLSIELMEEQKMLEYLIKDALYWTSARRLGDSWFWAMKSPTKGYVLKPFRYTNWARFEPDDRFFIEDCMIVTKKDRTEEGWHDINCFGSSAHVICEKWQ